MSAAELREKLRDRVQCVISRAFPSLHSIRWKLFIFHLVVLIVPAAYFSLHMLSAGGVRYDSNDEARVVRDFAWRTLADLAWPGLIGLLLAGVAAWFLAAYITWVIRDLALRANRIAAGEAGVKLETWTQSELGTLARALEKMRSRLEGKAYVEEMTANLSHELKTPLSAIRGAAELLEEGAADDPAARKKFLGNIQSEVGRLDRIVDNLLTLSRIESQPDAEGDGCDLAEIAAQVAERFSARASVGGWRFVAELQPGPLPCPVSVERAELVFNNLLENAFQFTPMGGTVRLVVKAGEIRVSDEGPGIEPALQRRIFERFFTTENPRTNQRGTGLGLAIVKSIVDAHRGSVSLRTEPGKGTDFVVKLPR